MLAKIALPIEPKDGTMGYYYEIPPHFQSKIALGQRVLVPFGKDEVVGYIFSIEPQRALPYTIKEVYALLDEGSYLAPSTFELALLVARYYFTNPYYVFELMFPKYKKYKKLVRYHLSETLPLPKALEALKGESYTIRDLDFSKKDLEGYLKKGYIEKRFHFMPQGKVKEESVYKIADFEAVKKIKNEKQARILALLETKPALSQKEIELALGESVTSSLKTLVKNGELVKVNKEIRRRPLLSEAFLRDKVIGLNESQTKAYESVCDSFDTYHGFLLHGVTGSGKTEVYIKLIQDALIKDKTALVLVPEISLTPQLFARFYSVFGEAVGLWHSGLSDGEKLDEWTNLINGHTKVLIGVRSAIFAPMKNLGIIIIDEAHDSSYKQSEPEPRYHAILVAEMLAKKIGIPIVFGSATPSVELMWKAEKGVYTYLSLPKRAKASLPIKILLCDMKAEGHYGDGYFISTLLFDKLETRLKKKEQSILYLNRRGFSTYVYCMECGEALTCPHCQSNLTYHKKNHVLKCHYCDESFEMPKACPTCHSETLQYKGYGTEQVEAYLKVHFPEARFCRLDYETTRQKDAYQKLLSDFQSGHYDVLIGTQMIAKGLDNENVTLVGVINADIGFNLLDYKAKERLFQQLVQVSGRAGRGAKEGEVLIQTYQPESELFSQVITEDYQAFYQNELKERALFEYPPFVTLLRIVISDTSEAYLKEVAKLISSEFLSYESKVTVYGPAPCPIKEVRGRFRYQFLLKGEEKTLYHLAWRLRHKYRHSKKSKTYRFMLDLAPETII